MGLEYYDLDASTRAFMIAEIERDIAAGSLYISENLNVQGAQVYPQLIRDAASQGEDASLAARLAQFLNSHEKPRKLKSGLFSKPPIMRRNAHEMLAEGEFNRYYIRAVCIKALHNGHETVEVYRAKAVENPRPDSAAKIGAQISASALLEDLRKDPGVDTALGLPSGPNSGLSVKLHIPTP